MTCDAMPAGLGAYAIGTLDADEVETVQAHVAGCAACRRELEVLSSLAQRLAQVDLTDVETHFAQPDDALFARIRERARDEAADEAGPVRTRSPWLGRRLLAVAAAVVVLGGAVAGVAVSRPHHSAKHVFSATAGQVSMRVVLQPQTQGTVLGVTVAGLPEEERCRLIAVATDGSSEVAGTWTATYAGEARVTESTTIAEPALDHLSLLGNNGQSLVTVPLRS